MHEQTNENRGRELDIAWAAGLFEGEGSLFVVSRANPKHRHVVAQMVSTDEDVVHRFRSVVNMGRVYGPYHSGVANHKPFWRWSIGSQRDMLALLEMIEPFLCSRRSAKAAEVRAEMATIRPQGMAHCLRGHEFTEENTLYSKNGKYMKRRCRTCEREWARERLGITPDRARLPKPLCFRVPMACFSVPTALPLTLGRSSLTL